MKKNSSLVFLIFLIVVLGLLFFLNYLYFQNKGLNSNTISLDELEQIKETHKIYEGNIDLYFHNTIIPYSSSDNFYLLYIENDNDYKKIYTISDFKIKLVDKENNHLIHLVLYNNKYYKEVDLELTNIPVISVDDENELNLYGFDNDIVGLKCEYSVRGDSSQSSEKKSYKLEIKNQRNEKIDLSLLNMSANNTWVLNPIYFDNTYMREKISFDIWNNLSDKFKHRLEYIELVLNGEYQGLYYLEEIVDIDTFNGDKANDLFVSIKDWKYNVEDEKIENASTIVDNKINEFEIEDGLDGNQEKQLEILRAFNKNFNDIIDDNIKLKYDLKNSVNYSVFINLTMAIDNTYKNQKILFRKVNNYYLIERTIWDLDWTFANENSKNFSYELSPSFTYVDLAVPESLRKDETYLERLKNTYIDFRTRFYNLNNLNSLINKYENYIDSYGASMRDIKKWGNYSYKESVDYLRDFFEQRIDILNWYYGGSHWNTEMNLSF